MKSVKEFLAEQLKHSWFLLYMLIYLPWFRYLEVHVTSYNVITCSLDREIPFCEYFVIPYLLWFVLMFGMTLFFFLYDKEEFWHYFGFLAAGMTMSLIICTIYPNGLTLRGFVNPNKNFCSYLVSVLRGTDTPTNVFPSIHVYNTLAVLIAMRSCRFFREHTAIRTSINVLGILIILSTMFLKQHSVIDVVGACAMASFFYLVFYRVWKWRVPEDHVFTAPGFRRRLRERTV